jgi:hypothetical protein
MGTVSGKMPSIVSRRSTADRKSGIENCVGKRPQISNTDGINTK